MLGASRVVKNGKLFGNVEYVADVIQKNTDGALPRIETIEEYPTIHDPLVEKASQEKSNNARPKLNSRIDDIADYDTIFIGYPNWWGGMPMPLYTFLETCDFNGKTIIPFSVHGGSGFSDTIADIERLQPNANVITSGYTISREEVASSDNSIIEWLNSLNIK